MLKKMGKNITYFVNNTYMFIFLSATQVAKHSHIFLREHVTHGVLSMIAPSFSLVGTPVIMYFCYSIVILMKKNSFKHKYENKMKLSFKTV